MSLRARLEQLRLGRNEIGPKNTGMLADVIARAGHLYELDLNGSGCTVQRITSALLSGTGAETLKVLNLGGNRLSRPDLARPPSRRLRQQPAYHSKRQPLWPRD